ncbi:NAD(P)H:quinone oxidoreductase [Virgibacillus sp. NKC19-16]|uniref:NAD(P)H:quinone oxidoreductase n=1 Tax=Virgibacillus salidurans TaxID=2831673 RepID=UPI001F2F9EE4|nr:NAD(P)H:quinone oxidoreductase [Virgibacillus sp. NKC19-16]UJL46232.1 NAD(P)H:quinone oxidoreductase [Virgibacillus sp. NKC19-16]
MGFLDKLFGKSSTEETEKMENVKLAIVYYSQTGTNYQLAKWAEESAKENGAEVRIVKAAELAPEAAIESNPAWKEHVEATKDVPEASSDDIEWADAIIFSMSTRFGGIPSQMKQFLDMQGGLWGSGKTVNKVVSAMSSAGNAHGGQEASILSLYTSLMHWGAIIVPPGYSDSSLFAAGGNPYGVSTAIDGEGNMVDDVEGAAKHQAKRTVDIAARVKAGN